MRTLHITSRTLHITTVALFTAFSIFSHADETSEVDSNLSEAFSKAALISMQLTAQKRVNDGEISRDVAACLNSAPSSAFHPVFEQALKDNLSSHEISIAKRFFKRSAGEKYVQSTIVQLYRAMGVQSPELMPQFSGDEYMELTKFTNSSAGNKLITKRVIDDNATRQSIDEKIHQLTNSCSDQVNIAKR